MGDMADWLTEQGSLEWDLHLSGDCLQDCSYCQQDDEDE